MIITIESNQGLESWQKDVADYGRPFILLCGAGFDHGRIVWHGPHDGLIQREDTTGQEADQLYVALPELSDAIEQVWHPTIYQEDNPHGYVE